jgi:hypothetical protein
LTSALDGVSGQRHAPAALYPRGKASGTHCTGGWVSLRAGLDTQARGKTRLSPPGIEPRLPDSPARSQTLYRLSYPTPAPNQQVNLICTIEQEHGEGMWSGEKISHYWHHIRIINVQQRSYVNYHCNQT